MPTRAIAKNKMAPGPSDINWHIVASPFVRLAGKSTSRRLQVRQPSRGLRIVPNTSTKRSLPSFRFPASLSPKREVQLHRHHVDSDFVRRCTQPDPTTTFSIRKRPIPIPKIGDKLFAAQKAVHVTALCWEENCLNLFNIEKLHTYTSTSSFYLLRLLLLLEPDNSRLCRSETYMSICPCSDMVD